VIDRHASQGLTLLKQLEAVITLEMKLPVLLLITSLLASGVVAQAKGGSGRSGGHSRSSVSPGTGSKLSSERVRAYNKKDGKHVDSYRRSTPDPRFANNWSTKGNRNLVTGKNGTKVTPPKK